MDVKLEVPGWRIEQKFNNKVLIGNWNEERRKFHRGSQPFGNSTHRIDYSNYGRFIPDKSIRRSASLKNEGLPKTFIFSHHGQRYSNNMISWYDQHMNQRYIKETNLPELRTWDGKTMAWLPEKTDHPLQGAPTNFGLAESLQKKWSKLNALDKGVYCSTYRQSYNEHAKNDMVFKHHATSKPLSSHFHSHRVNKDLPFRNQSVNISPEFPPIVSG